MRLRRLCKSNTSDKYEQSPAMYIAETPTLMVAQGWELDDATSAELVEVAPNESGVSLPTETVLRAAALFLAEHGRPAMRAEVESFLADWPAVDR